MSYLQKQSQYPYFCVRNSAAVTDGVLNTMFTADVTPNFFDQAVEPGAASGYAAGKYTAPVKGLYYVSIILCCKNNGAAGADDGKFGFAFKRAAADTVETIRTTIDNPGNISTTNREYISNFSTIVQLDAGGYVRVYAIDFGDAQTYMLQASYFMGHLITAFN